MGDYMALKLLVLYREISGLSWRWALLSDFSSLFYIVRNCFALKASLVKFSFFLKVWLAGDCTKTAQKKECPNSKFAKPQKEDTSALCLPRGTCGDCSTAAEERSLY